MAIREVTASSREVRSSEERKTRNVSEERSREEKSETRKVASDENKGNKVDVEA